VGGPKKIGGAKGFGWASTICPLVPTTGRGVGGLMSQPSSCDRRVFLDASMGVECAADERVHQARVHPVGVLLCGHQHASNSFERLAVRACPPSRPPISGCSFVTRHSTVGVHLRPRGCVVESWA
jgi:hypothetical protein